MNTTEILKDSFKYPLSNWTSYLILGIILLFSNISDVIQYDSLNIIFLIVMIITVILTLGYTIKIFKCSLSGSNTPPVFNNWKTLATDGLKAILITIVYTIPLGIIVAGFTILLLLLNTDYSTAFTGIIIITIAFLLIIFPLIYLGLVNMVKNDGKISSAFEIRKILKIISNAGWGKFLILFITLIIFYLIFELIMAGLELILSSSSATLVTSIFINPFVMLFMYRVFVLFYMDGDKEQEETL